jgi:ubiquitin carboxyl-terminal hydrolase 34
VYFFRPQTLDDKIFCEEMGEKTCIVKRTFINHFPNILIFTLKRFEFDVENMVRKKLNDYLEFP